MRSLIIKKIILFAGLLTFLSGCGGYRSIDQGEKNAFIRSNGVFSEKVLTAAVLDDLNGQFPVMEVQGDDGATDNQQNDDGSPYNPQGDDGSPTVPQNDDGMPTPSDLTDDGMPFTPYNTINLRRCQLTDDGLLGVQYLLDDGRNYGPCSPCAVFDDKSNKCIKVNVTPKKKKKNFLKVGALLLGLVAITAIVNQNTPNGQVNVPPPQGNPPTPQTNTPPHSHPQFPPYDINDPNSPLMIDVSGSDDFNLENLELSSPEDGIDFNIRGRKNNNKKLRISWTNSPRYQFLVKPNKYGQVLGIDEMFGNNTYGPDKKFAEHGFEALDKHDGLDYRGKQSFKDKIISKEDAIFSQLRLWHDKNYDGYAQADELKTLEEFGIEAIDIDYDSNFYERDIYGNEAIFKSVVKFESGKLGMMFDLWFR